MPRRVPDVALLSALLLAVLTALLVAACGPTSPIKPDPANLAGRAAAVQEQPLLRPVIVPERVADEMLAAIALLKEKNFRQAEVNLEEVIKLRPDIAEAQFNLGWARYQMNQCPAAMAPLQTGLLLKPGDAGALNLLAICERMLGRFAAAEATYLQALALAPDNDRLHLNIGILYELYLFKPQQALTHYRRYQSLQGTPDTRVGGWIALIERQEAK